MSSPTGARGGEQKVRCLSPRFSRSKLKNLVCPYSYFPPDPLAFGGDCLIRSASGSREKQKYPPPLIVTPACCSGGKQEYSPPLLQFYPHAVNGRTQDYPPSLTVKPACGLGGKHEYPAPLIVTRACGFPRSAFADQGESAPGGRTGL